MKYIQSFLKMNCSSELLDLFRTVHNPIKEISESYAAFRHCKSLLNFNDVTTNVFIGDGSRCLTGALFSFMRGKNNIVENISIDPLINQRILEDWMDEHNVENFKYFNTKFQELHYNTNDTFNIILVHSHVDIYEVDKIIPNWNYMYVNPCCMRDKQIFNFDYMKEHNIVCLKFGKDNNILSDKNEVFIYKKY